MIQRLNILATCLLTTILLLSSCDPIFDLFEPEYHYSAIYNKSNDGIYSFIDFESYPDTSHLMFIHYELTNPYPLFPGKRKIIMNSQERELLSDTDTIMIYIYTDSIIKDFTLQEIYEKHIVAARYDLSKSDLETLKENIYYPPTAAMNGIKMYIPKK